MKTNAFEITPRRVAILGWSVCLCVVFLLLQFSENYGQHIDELSADGFSVASAATDVSPLLRICGVAVALCSVVAWEQLRHAQSQPLLAATDADCGAGAHRSRGCGCHNALWCNANGCRCNAVEWFWQVPDGVIILQRHGYWGGKSVFGHWNSPEVWWQNTPLRHCACRSAGSVDAGWRVLHLFIYERRRTHFA